MKSLKLGVAATAVALLGVTQAHGATWSLGSGKYSKVVGAQHETFDSLAVDPKEALNLSWSGNKGLILAASDSTKGCYKPGSVGNFFCGRGSTSAPGKITFDLSATPADYYGFRWGSIDFFNTVSFYDGDVLLLSLTGTQVSSASGGLTAGYFNVYAGAGESITRAVLESSRNSIETDNHAVHFEAPALAMITQVPEPSTYALLLAGLGLVGLAARRRSQR